MDILKYCVYLNRVKSKKKLTRQKNRISSSKTYDSNKFIWDCSGLKNRTLILTKEIINIELYIYKIFIKKLRKLNKRKRFKTKIRFCSNRVYSKKSTNSRMGKGKGKMQRLFYSSSYLKPVAIFFKCSKIRSSRFFKILKNSHGKKFLMFRNY